jgi:hypothetical protein
VSTAGEVADTIKHRSAECCCKYSITAAADCYMICALVHASYTLFSLQLSGRDYDEKTDIYSLGIMLFEMSHPSFRTAMERTIVSDMAVYTLQL